MGTHGLTYTDVFPHGHAVIEKDKTRRGKSHLLRTDPEHVRECGLETRSKR